MKKIPFLLLLPFIAHAQGAFSLGTPTVYAGPSAANNSVVLGAPTPSSVWNASANDAWLHVTAGSSSGTGSALVQFSYDANGGSTRTGSLTVAGQTLTVVQAGATFVGTGGQPRGLAAAGLSGASAITFDAQGNLYFCDSNNNAVKMWTASNQQVTTVFSNATTVGLSLNYPLGVAVDAQGNVYVSDTLNNTIRKWTRSTGTMSVVLDSTQVDTPYQLAFDSAGKLYIADGGHNAIKVWDGTTLTTLISGLHRPEGIAIDAAGNLYIADNASSSIKKWIAATQTLATLIPGLNAPDSVAVDGRGNVFYVDGSAFRWDVLTQQSANLWGNGVGGGVAVDATGLIVYGTDSYFTQVKEAQFGWVSPSSVSEPAAGGSGSLQILPPSAYVPASSDQSWLTIGTTNNGTIAFSVAANVVTSQRTASLDVHGRSIVVTEAAGSPGPPANIAKSAGDNQSAAVLVPFGTALAVTVTDSYGNAVPGVNITFAAVAGGSGASGTFSGSATVATGSNGVATAPTLTANGTLGAFTVTATASSFTATFNLTNAPPVFTKAAGDNQSAATGGAFVTALQVKVTDASANPIAGVPVTFTPVAGGSGASATFGGSTTVTSNAQGFATAPVLTANGTAGAFTVTATGSGPTVTFNLTNVQPTYSLGVASLGVGKAAAASSVLVISSPQGAAWSAVSNDSWLHVTTASGTAGSPMLFTFDANAGTAVRTGTFTISGQTFSVTQAGTGFVTANPSKNLATGLNSPNFIAYDTQNNVYFADSNNGAVKKWTRSSGVVSTIMSGLSYPWGVAVDGAGNVYATDNGANGNLLKWTASTGVVSILSSSFNSPIGVAIDGQGNLYVADYMQNAIIRWDASTQQLSTVVSGLNGPEGVALDAAGNIFILDTFVPALREYKIATGQLVNLQTTGFTNPASLAVDGLGNAYIGDFNAGCVWKWSAVTGAMTSLITGTNFVGVAADPQGGYIYITEIGANTAREYDFTSVGPSAISEPATAATDSAQALPSSVLFSATSDQTWLTISGVANGVISFSTTANVITSSRTAHITALGKSLTVTQAAGTAGPPAAVAKTAGDSQTTIPGSSFATALKVTVTDANGNLVPNASVTFTAVAGGSGAGASFTGSSTVTTNASGVATAPVLTANGTTGTFTVTATAGSITATFNLSIAAATVTKTAGDSQSAVANSTFATALQVTVTNSGTPVSGASVTFTPVAGGGGSNATFTGSSTVTTNASGIATAPTLTANATTGAFSVTATAGGSSVTFNLTITSGSYLLAASSMAADLNSGSARVMVVVSPSSATWSATANDSWLHITTASGTGSGLVPFTWDANTGASARTGTLTISGQTFTVTQAGTSYAATNTVSFPVGVTSPNGLVMDAQGNIYVVTGTTVKKWTKATNTLVNAITGLSAPQGLGIDPSGNVYVADNGSTAANKAIRKWTGSGAFTTVVSSLSGPNAVAADAAGNIYFTDASTLKRWNSGTTTTLISTGVSTPRGLALDAAGTLYIADTGNNAIKKCVATSCSALTTVLSGTSNVRGPIGIAADGMGNIYYSDTTTNANGVKSWSAANGVQSLFTGSNTAKGVAVDPSGSNIYFAETGFNDFALIQYAWVTPSSATVTASGGTRSISVLPSSQFVTPSSDQSWATIPANTFSSPVTVTIAANTGVSRTANITVLGVAVPITQAAPPPGAIAAVVKIAGDSQSSALSTAFGTALKVQVSDAVGIPEPGVSVTFAPVAGGSGATGTFSGSASVTTDSNGFATAPALTANGTAGTWTVTATSGGITATFTLSNVVPTFTLGAASTTVGAAAGSSNALVLAVPSAPWTASSNASWLHIAASGSTYTVPFTYDANAGAALRTGTLTIGGGTFTVTQVGAGFVLSNQQSSPISTGLSFPQGTALDAAGNLYIADSSHSLIKKWTKSTGVTSTITTATGLSIPDDVASDAAGNLYIADTQNSAIKKWTASSGTIATLVAYPDVINPRGIAIDGAGNIYIADQGNNRIAKWNGTTTSTVFSAGLSNAYGVAVDPAGNVFGVDQSLNTVFMWKAATQQVSTIVTGLSQAFDAAADGYGNLYIVDGAGIKVWNPVSGQVTTLPSTGTPVGVTVDTTGNNIYYGDFGTTSSNGRARLTIQAWTGPSTFSEPATAGSDNAYVLPANETFTATSDQTWLTIGTPSNGVIPFTMTANPGGTSRVAHIIVLGNSLTVTQAGAPILSIAKSHSGNFAQGQSGSYSLTVSNAAGAVATSGTVTVTENPPSGLTVTGMSGTGWTCSAPACTRTDALPTGASYPAISVTASVAGNAASPLVNSASVSGGGGATASITDSTVIAPTVTGIAASTANGAYTTGSTIAINITFGRSMIVTGTPKLALNSGGFASYASGSGGAILTFNYVVAAGENAALLNEASTSALTLNGGTIVDGAAIAANLTVPASGAAGSLGANSSIVIDTGAPTVSAVTSTTANGAYSTGATVNVTVTFNEAVTVTGTPQIALNSGGTAIYASGSGATALAFTYTVATGQSAAHLDYAAADSLTGTIKDAAGNVAPMTLAAPGAAGSLAANSNVAIQSSPDLTIAKQHSGSFYQGQTGAAYTLAVSNIGLGPTSGTVTVADTLPGGLTATAISGSGWACDLPSVSCSRTDVLASGSSYANITVTVTVAANAAASVTNHAAVSGGGDASSGNNSADDVTAIRQSTTTALQSSLNPSTYGASVSFTATVTSVSGTPSGTVQFYDGAATLGSPVALSSGSATYSTSVLTAHAHSITAVYSGSSFHLASTSSALSQVVNGLATSIALASSANPSMYGQPVTFTATISSGTGTPTGALTFFDGATSIGSGVLSGGVATLTLSSLAIGTRSITAAFSADDVYAGSTSAAIGQVVMLATSSVALSSSTNPSNLGQSVTFTATVTASGGVTPTGVVTFKDGTLSIGQGTMSGGIASFATSSLGAGTHSITAVYAGDGQFAGATSLALSQLVQKLSPTVNLSSGTNPSVTGQLIPLSVSVSGSGATPTGSVTISDGGTAIGSVSLSAGAATLSVALTATGSTHSLTAQYAGDATYTAGTSSALSQSVNAASTTLSLTASSNPALMGSPVTFTATIAVSSPGQGSTAGTINFLDGGVSIGTGTLSGGSAALTTSSLSAGSHTITATFAASTAFGGSTSSPLTQSITSTGTATTLASSANPSVLGQTVTLTATVTASGGTTPQGTITFFNGATQLGSPVTLTGGIAAISTSSLSSGTASLTATYASTNGLTASTSGILSQVMLVPVTVQSSPGTAQFTVDGTAYTGTQTFNWTAGSSHALAASSPQAVSGTTQLVWASWSNGASGASQTVTAPSTATTYTVNFATQYLVTVNPNPTIGGSATGGGWYTAGAPATITATPNSGYAFANFSGGVATTTTNPLTVTVNAALTIGANFTPQTPALNVAVGTRSDGTVAGTRNVNMTLSNNGAGSAYNSQITAIVTITTTGGSGTITLVSGVPGPNPGVLLAPGTNTTVPLVFNWPATATRASITLRLTATDSTGTVSYPVTQTVTSFR